MNHCTRLGMLIVVTSGICALAGDMNSRVEDLAITTDTFTAVDGVLELRLNSAAVQQAGLTLLGGAACVADLSLADVEYRVFSVNDQVRAGAGGDVAMRCAPFGLASRTGLAEVYETPRFVHDATGGSVYEFSIRDGGEPVFHLTAMRMELRRDYRALLMDADVRITHELAERLGSEAAAGAIIGRALITMRIVLTESVVTDVRDSTERAPSAVESNATPGPDVIVGDLPATGQFGRVGPLGSGTVRLSVGTTSCNKGDTPFNWFALPNTDHPMIPMNMYRLKIVD